MAIMMTSIAIFHIASLLFQLRPQWRKNAARRMSCSQRRQLRTRVQTALNVSVLPAFVVTAQVSVAAAVVTGKVEIVVDPAIVTQPLAPLSMFTHTSCGTA